MGNCPAPLPLILFLFPPKIIAISLQNIPEK